MCLLNSFGALTQDQKNGNYIEDEVGIFKSGTLINNLLPETYVVTVVKDDFYPWQKNIPVEPGVVSVFDTIILFPQDGAERIDDPVEAFYFRDNKFIEQDGGFLNFEENRIIGDTLINFTESGSVISYNSNNDTYYLSDISDLSRSLNINLTFNKLKETKLGLVGAVPIKKIEPYPFDDGRFVVMTERALYVLNTDSMDIEQIDGARDFVVIGNEVFWVNDEGVSSYNLVFRNRSDISNLRELDANSISEIKTSPSTNDIALLSDKKKLYILNSETGTTTVVSNNANSFSFSPDSKILLFIEGGNTLRAYKTSDVFVGDQTITIKTIPGIITDSISWHKDSAHIFVKDSSSNLRFVEIEDNLPINDFLVSSGVRSFMYDQKEGILYFNSPSGIYGLEI